MSARVEPLTWAAYCVEHHWHAGFDIEGDALLAADEHDAAKHQAVTW